MGSCDFVERIAQNWTSARRSSFRHFATFTRIPVTTHFEQPEAPELLRRAGIDTMLKPRLSLLSYLTKSIFKSQPQTSRFLPSIRLLSTRSLIPSRCWPSSSSIVSSQTSACLQCLVQTRGMKTRSSVKRLCEGCKPVRRKNRVYIICDRNPKHKQRQGK